MKLQSLSTLAIALTASGCATVATKPFTNSIGTSPTAPKSEEGISYNLPKAQFTLSIAHDEGALVVAIVAPLITADPETALITRLPVGVISNNEFNITISDRNLLSTAKGYSEGQLSTIIENAIKSAINVQGSDASGAVEFYRKNFDFSDAAGAITEGNKAISSYVATNCPGATSLAGDEASKKHCAALRKLIPSTRSNINFFSVSVEKQKDQPLLAVNVRLGGTNSDAYLAQCPRDSLCYHPLVPVTLTLDVPGHFSKSDSYLIPDKTRIAFVKPRGGVFAKQEYDYVFTQGVLTGYKQVSRSELVGLTALPLTIVKSIISAPAEALAARGTALGAESKYLNDQQSNVDARKKLEKTCAENPGLCASSTTRILGSKAGKPVEEGASQQPATSNRLGNPDPN